VAGDYEIPFDADDDVTQLLNRMQDGDEWARDRLESLLEGNSRINAYERMLAGLRAVSETPVEEMDEAVAVLANLFEYDHPMAEELQNYVDELRNQHDQDVKLGDFDETEFQQNLNILMFLESNFAGALAQEPDESPRAIPEVPDSFFKNLSNMTPTSATSAIISAIHQAGVRKTSVDEGVGRNIKQTVTTAFGRAIQLGGLVSD
jgi:hypothetical protein